MKRGKRKTGQISVFIILAIVIVAAGGIAFFMANNKSNTNVFNDPSTKPQYEDLLGSIEDCTKSLSMDALDTIGIQGGYYNAPKESFDLGWAFIPYYYKEGSFLMPATIVIENELGAFVDDNIEYCLESIDKQGFDVSYDATKSKTKSSISNGRVDFKIDIPISIKKESKSAKLELEEMPVSLNSKLFEMLEIARFITDSHKEDPEMMCISCVADMAMERNLYVDMLDFGDNATTLTVISQNNTESYPIALEFLNKYPEI
ncbi:MAG: hypothetical protein Q8N99_04840 [Nanoarchaeota archaeon]|nr:hypothetical protein [Nanoarchaeota archaeon]